MSVESEELHRIARSIFQLAERSEQDAHLFFKHPDLVDVAGALYRLSGERERVLPPGLAREAGWNILLDLYIQESKGKPVSITSACIASKGSMTNALRWIGLLQSQALILREGDASDKRRSFLRLSIRGKREVEAALRVVEERLRNLYASGGPER